MLKIPYQKLRLSSKGNLKNYILQSIPVLSIFALVGIMSYAISITSFGLFTNNKQEVYAAESTASTTTGASASLTVDNNTFYDNINAEYGITNYASHKVTISADNIDGYTLTITGPTNLTAPSGSNATTSDVTKWGYAWTTENATEANLTYSNFTGSAQNLETNTNIVNNSVNLTKKLVFAATFTNNASDGHYKGTVGLGLTVTPRALNALEQISLMQQMTPDICDAATIGDAAVLVDGRDGSKYDVKKVNAEQCWMTQNLRIVNKTISSTDSDMTSGSFTIPASSTSGFSSNTASNAYYPNDTTKGAYYTWCAATAGSCSSATSGGTNATSSICPKGWHLPVGGTGTSGTNTGATSDTKNDFMVMAGKTSTGSFTDASLVSGTNITLGTTTWPFTGYYTYGAPSDVGTIGYYWSRTAYSSTNAYDLSVSNNGFVGPTSNSSRSTGFSVRCVAYNTEAPAEYTYTLEYNSTGRYIPWGMASLPSPQTTTTSETSLQLEIAGSIYTKDTSVQQCGSASSYSDQYGNTYTPGSTITLTPDKPHLILTISGTSSLGKCYSA